MAKSFQGPNRFIQETKEEGIKCPCQGGPNMFIKIMACVTCWWKGGFNYLEWHLPLYNSEGGHW